MIIKHSTKKQKDKIVNIGNYTNIKKRLNNFQYNLSKSIVNIEKRNMSFVSLNFKILNMER